MRTEPPKQSKTYPLDPSGKSDLALWKFITATSIQRRAFQGTKNRGIATDSLQISPVCCLNAQRFLAYILICERKTWFCWCYNFNQMLKDTKLYIVLLQNKLNFNTIPVISVRTCSWGRSEMRGELKSTAFQRGGFAQSSC